MRPLLLAALCRAALGAGVEADAHVVLPPPTNATSLPERMLVFIPGGKVPNEHYSSTAASIQAAVSDHIRLWVAIPAVFLRLCIISCSTRWLCSPLHAAVESALSAAVALGWHRGGDDAKDIWLAGHSLGGVCANRLFQAYRSGSALPYAGLLVMGSYVDEDGDYDLLHYPAPVLTLNAELDGGMARPGKTSKWWRQYLDAVKGQGQDYALEHKPVLVLPGLNHSDFCPGFDVPGDLPAEVGQAEATAVIGRVAAAFLQAQVGNASVRAAGIAVLRERAAWTRELLTPYLAMQEQERSAQGDSPFCKLTQHVVAGLPAADDARVGVADRFEADASAFGKCQPESAGQEGGNLSVHTCSHADYYSDVANTGSIAAASQLACKMFSGPWLAERLNVSAPASGAQCREANRRAVELAEAHAPPWTLARFRRSGRGWCFEGDVPTAGGCEQRWAFKEALSLKENATCMAVASPSLQTPTAPRSALGSVGAQAAPAGRHYCKVLSPARALDWMMTDSLKPAPSAVEADAGMGYVVV